MQKISVYLAGKIQKAHEDPNEFYWSKQDLEKLTEALKPYSVTLLNPADRSDDLSNNKSTFGRDMTQAYISDFIFVDARDRRGLGVGAEMMWAKVNKIPLIILAPRDTHYHQSKTILLGVDLENWKHPFVDMLGDAVVETIEEGANWIKAYLSNANNSLAIKDETIIFECMHEYLDNQLAKDEPMQKLLKENQNLGKRISKIRHSELA